MAKKTKTSLVKSADAKKIMEKQGAACATSPELLEILQKNMASFELLKSKFDDGVVPEEQFVSIEEVDEAGSDMSDLKTEMSELKALVEGLAKNAKPKEAKTDDENTDDDAKKAEELEKAAAPIAAQIASEALAGMQAKMSSLMSKLDSGASISREEVDSVFDGNWEVRNMISLASTSMAKSDGAPKQDVIDAAVKILTKNIDDAKNEDEEETEEEKAKKAELAKAELEKSAPVGFSMDLSPALDANNE
jgi:hypothetical protein